MPSPTKHPKTGVYYFRRAVPSDLRDKLGWEIKVSLQTKDSREAKRRFIEELAKYEQLIESARSGYTLTDKVAQALAGNWLRQALEADERIRETGVPEEEQYHSDPESFPYDIHLDLLSEAAENGSAARVLADDLHALIRTEGLPIEKGSEDYERLANALLKAQLEFYSTLNGRTRGDWSPVEVLSQYPEYVPPTTRAPRSVRTIKVSGKGDRLSDLYEAWKKERNPPPKTDAEFSRGIRRFIELHGDRPALAITKPMVREYKEALRECPVALSGKLRTATLPEVLRASREDPRSRTLSPGSINKHLTAISTVLSWAGSNGYFDSDPNWSNPATGIKVTEKPNGTEKRLPYSEDDLKVILRFPIFSEGERPRAAGGEAAVWLPLMALFSGARVEELGQLLATDVACENDVWFFHINTLDEGKRVKTAGSRRKVPLHPDLIKAGFLEYWKQRKTSGDSRLFPDLKADRFGQVTGNWSKWWGRYARSHGVTDPRKVFHSFRHTFKTACRKAHVPKEINDAITGHRSGDVGDDYGEPYPVAVLAPELAKVRFDGLILPDLGGGNTRRKNS